jgi:hypothetical protein
MSQYVDVPPQRLPADVLQALLEEFASRDGTDYGERELALAEKVQNLRQQLSRKELCILFAADAQEWDLVPREQALDLLQA